MIALRTGPYTDPLLPSMTCNITLTEPWWHKVFVYHCQLIWDGPCIKDGQAYFLRLCTCHRAWWVTDDND